MFLITWLEHAAHDVTWCPHDYTGQLKKSWSIFRQNVSWILLPHLINLLFILFPSLYNDKGSRVFFKLYSSRSRTSILGFKYLVFHYKLTLRTRHTNRLICYIHRILGDTCAAEYESLTQCPNSNVVLAPAVTTLSEIRASSWQYCCYIIVNAPFFLWKWIRLHWLFFSSNIRKGHPYSSSFLCYRPVPALLPVVQSGNAFYLLWDPFLCRTMAVVALCIGFFEVGRVAGSLRPVFNRSQSPFSCEDSEAAVARLQLDCVQLNQWNQKQGTWVQFSDSLLSLCKRSFKNEGRLL